MSDTSYVSGNLYKINEKISGAAKKEGEQQQTAEQKQEQSMLNAAYLERFKDYQRIKRDFDIRFTENYEFISASCKQLSERAAQLQQTLSEFDGIRKKIDGQKEPDMQSPEFQKEVREACRVCETARLEIIRLSAAMSGSDIRERASFAHERKDFAVSEISGGMLFSKGFWVFLPLGLWMLFASFLLAAAFVIAWKVAL